MEQWVLRENDFNLNCEGKFHWGRILLAKTWRKWATQVCQGREFKAKGTADVGPWCGRTLFTFENQQRSQCSYSRGDCGRRWGLRGNSRTDHLWSYTSLTYRSKTLILNEMGIHWKILSWGGNMVCLYFYIMCRKQLSSCLSNEK